MCSRYHIYPWITHLKCGVLLNICSQISLGLFSDDTDLYVVTIRRGSVIADFDVEVNKTISAENIQSTLVDAAKFGNLSLPISPDSITASGMYTKITVRLKLFKSLETIVSFTNFLFYILHVVSSQ